MLDQGWLPEGSRTAAVEASSTAVQVACTAVGLAASWVAVQVACTAVSLAASWVADQVAS